MLGVPIRLPAELFWITGGIAVVAGLFSILFPNRIVRCLRVWLMRQLRWVKSPRYRFYLKLQGWLLFVLATLMMLLMVIIGQREIRI